MKKKGKKDLSKVIKDVKAKKEKKPIKRLSAFSILFIILSMIVAIIIYFVIKHIWITLEYKEYKEKMDWYGFNNLYDNTSAKSTEKVSNSEMIKVIIGSIKNQRNVDYVNFLQDPQYENEAWVDYAKGFSLITQDEMSLDNQNKKANELSAVMVISKVVSNVLEKDVEMSDVKFTNINKFNDEDQLAIKRGVALGMLQNKKGKINDDNKLIKGKLNKMIINIVEKYSTIYYNVESTGASIVTDGEKLPNNNMDFPYIVNNIDKEVYEISFNKEREETFLTPKQSYEKRGQLYGQIDELATGYLNTILNLDYTNISKESFTEKIAGLTLYLLNGEQVLEYVNYVKDNKIKIEGHAQVLLPIFYYSGEQNILRVKVSFKILSSETDKNILFGDLYNFKNIEYSDKEYSFYIDMPLGITINSISLKVPIKSIPTLIISDGIKIKAIE